MSESKRPPSSPITPPSPEMVRCTNIARFFLPEVETHGACRVCSPGRSGHPRQAGEIIWAWKPFSSLREPAEFAGCIEGLIALLSPLIEQEKVCIQAGQGLLLPVRCLSFRLTAEELEQFGKSIQVLAEEHSSSYLRALAHDAFQIATRREESPLEHMENPDLSLM